MKVEMKKWDFPKKLKFIMYVSVKELQDPYYQGFAGQIAFYFMMSIMPIVILLSYVLSYFRLSMDAIYEIMERYLTGEAADFLMNMLRHQGAGGGLSVALVIVAIYSASKFHYCLMCIANHTYSKSKGKGFLIERFRAMLNILLTLAAIALALVILVYGEPLLRMIYHLVVPESIIEVTEITLSKVLLWLRWPVMFAIFFFTIVLNYYFLPTEKMKLRKVLPGGLFASLGTIAITLLFSYYTTNIINYNTIYGSASSLVALMVWFYLISWVIVLGLVLNEALIKAEKDSTTPETKEMVKELLGLVPPFPENSNASDAEAARPLEEAVDSDRQV